MGCCYSALAPSLCNITIAIVLSLSRVVSLPANQTYVFTGSNRTVDLPERTLEVADGLMTWPGINRAASFAVLPSLLSSHEVSSIMSKLPQDFDMDKDTVDDESSFEFYLEKDGTFDAVAGIPGKPDADAKVLGARQPIREKLAALTRPILETRITAFVNRHVQTCSLNKCRACFSLIRRYLDGERRNHDMHFDIQALATVVVSLSSFGQDFEGGLFVGTGYQSKQFIALQKGDAIVHESDLLHGVHVSSGARWSWILWYKDANDCVGKPLSWHRQQAIDGDPVAQFIHAHRVEAFGKGQAEGQVSEASKLWWLRKSAEAGFTRAMNELGHIYSQGLGVEVDQDAGLYWLRRAAEVEPDAMFNLGMLMVRNGDKKEQKEGIKLLKRAAKLGNSLAMTNLGVALYLGQGGVRQDLKKAIQWLKRAGSADAMYMAGNILLETGAEEHGLVWLGKAAMAGNDKAQQELVPHLVEKAMRVGRPLDAMVRKAAPWLRQLASMGNPASQFLFSKVMLEGETSGQKQSREEGIRVMRLAARQGFPAAQQFLQIHSEL